MEILKNNFKKAELYGAAVFIMLLLLTQYFSYQRYTIIKISEKDEIYNAAINARERIQNVFIQNKSVICSLRR